MDAVIEIKTSNEAWPDITNCNGGCDLFWNSPSGCIMRWADKQTARTRSGYLLDYWGPSDKCPGPTRYRLVRVEEE